MRKADIAARLTSPKPEITDTQSKAICLSIKTFYFIFLKVCFLIKVRLILYQIIFKRYGLKKDNRGQRPKNGVHSREAFPG